MKIKVIVLLLVLGAVLISGCVGNQQKTPETNATPAETAASSMNATPGENLTSGENATAGNTVTPEENGTAEANTTSKENVTSGTGVVSSTGIRETPYTVRLANYRATPTSLEIKKGESVAWMNLQDNPKRKFTLVSQEGLFENKTLTYRQPFDYTFNETGNYNFTVIGQPRMSVSVSVTTP